MKVIDLGLYAPDPFAFKTKEGKEYQISFVSAAQELKLMNEQGNILERSQNMRLLEQQDIERWKHLVKNILKEQAGQELDEGDINRLSPLDVIAILMALIQYLNKRSEVIYQAFDDNTRKQIQEQQEEIKKKMM